MAISLNLVFGLIAVAATALAAQPSPAIESPRLDSVAGASVCEAAADEAERAFGLPAGLLRAIGIVESGRWHPALNRVAPWPYAIDAGGYSLFMTDLPDAVAKVAALRQDGFESIDVGCFQINLLFHPDAFATLEEAFDPRGNARYAAGFLVSLFARSGSWEQAVADYHSAVASIGEPYRARVYAAWEGAPVPAFGTARSAGPLSVVTLWGGGLPVVLTPTHDLFRPSPEAAIRAPQAVSAGWFHRNGPWRSPIQVFSPGEAISRQAAPPAPPPRAIAVSMRVPPLGHSATRRLPGVFTPTGLGP